MTCVELVFIREENRNLTIIGLLLILTIDLFFLGHFTLKR